MSRDGIVLNTISSSDVPSLTRSGAMWSGGLVLGQQIIRLMATMVMARILLPSDYGLLGMAATLTAFLQLFSDAGLGLATIQREDLREVQVHNLFWVNVVLGAAFTLTTVAASPAVSWFFDRHELQAIVSALGLGFFLGGLSVQPLALLKRNMQFKALAGVELTALFVAAVVGVTSAVLGCGYWALVLQSLAGTLTRTICAFSVSGYRPRMPQLGAGTLPLVNFGGQMAMYGILVYVSRNLDNVLIGKFWGAEELGYYGRAYFLMLLPSMLATAVAANVMVPALARLQGDREKLGSGYRKAAFAVGFISVPVAIEMGFCASELVGLVYGRQWLPVVPILRWLAVAGVTQGVFNSYGWLYTAVGDGHGAFRWGLTSTVVVTVAFGVGVNWGAVGVAIAYAVSAGLILTVPALYLAHRSAGISFYKTLRALAPIGVGATAMLAALGLALFLFHSMRSTWQAEFAIKVATGGIVYLSVVKLSLGTKIRTIMRSILGVESSTNSTL